MLNYRNKASSYEPSYATYDLAKYRCWAPDLVKKVKMFQTHGFLAQNFLLQLQSWPGINPIKKR